MKNSKPLFSIIIPNYNTGDLLFETLDSILDQNINLEFIETIIIDDCSNDAETIAIIDKLYKDQTYKNLPLKVLKNEANLWVAETRNRGVNNSNGEYLVMLDSDDTLTPDYLSLSYITLQTFPTASWVYPSVLKFGFRNCVDIAPNFSAKTLFVENYCVVTAMMHRSLWLDIGGQRIIKVAHKLHLHEDWDFWQQALKKGRYGVPLKKTVFGYRQRLRSNITRNDEESNVTMLLSIRKNWLALFGIPRAQNAYRENNLYVEKPGTIQRLMQRFAKATINRAPKKIPLSDAFLYFLFPKLFVKKRLSKKKIKTKAHKMGGFVSNFEIDFDAKTKLTAKATGNKKIIITHFFWHLGGAENVLLKYIQALHKDGYDIIDIVVDGRGKGDEYKSDFKKFVTRQYDLSHISDEFQYPKIKALWEIIKFENPDKILNMSNPYTYILLPEIKKYMPHIHTYDLIHNEEFDDTGWFGAAESFQDKVDTRIVISDFWKRVLIEKYNEPADKVKVVKNFINYKTKFVAKPSIKTELRKFYKIKVNITVVGFIGRIDNQKQPDIFISLAKRLTHRDDLIFVMIGDGPLLKQYQSEIASLTNLIQIPATPVPQRMLNLFDIAVFPSLYEGYPMVGLECAAMNIPLVVPKITGFDEQITLGNFGVTYQPTNTKEDAIRIADILENDIDHILSLGPNGSHFIDTHHNSDEIEKTIIDTFNAT